MSFMHFETMSVVAGLEVITLSGTLGSPNVASHSSTATTVSAGWNFAGLTTTSIEKGSANRKLGTAYSVPKAQEWNNNKDFVRQFWIRARHDPGATGDSAWGTAPGAGTLNSWLELDPDVANHEWLWSNTTTGTTVQGVIEVMIAADNGGSLGTVLATGYYKGSAQKIVSGGGGTGGCFTGGMRILMADGTQKCIADILAGDRVKSYDFRTKKLVNVLVKRTMVPRICDIYEVKLSNGTVIETTEEHPFRTADGKWASVNPDALYQPAPGGEFARTVANAQLREGTVLHGVDDSVRVAKIVETGRTETVYHLSEVGEYSNFFVEGVCVHNIESERAKKD